MAREREKRLSALSLAIFADSFQENIQNPNFPMSPVQNLTRPRFFQFSEVKKTSFARASAHLPPAETFLGYARFGNAKTKYFSNKVHG